MKTTEYFCNGVKILDDCGLATNGTSATAGTFTGTVTIPEGADLCKPLKIVGTAEFDNGEQAARVVLADCYVDLTANGEAVYCLFYDPNWKAEFSE